MTFADATSRDAYLPNPLHHAVEVELLPIFDGGLECVVASDFIDGVWASSLAPGLGAPEPGLSLPPASSQPSSVAEACPTVTGATPAARIRPGLC
jgi:hypothetical protein